MKTAENKSYSEGTSTEFGYVVEWRLKPKSKVLAEIWEFQRNCPSEEWHHGPYTIEQLRRSKDTALLMQPVISDWAHRMGHGLVGRACAVAIIACLQTSLESNLLKHVEWRISRIEIRKSHKLTRSEDDKEMEERMKEISEILSGGRIE